MVLPNFICPGAAKAGTTSLYEILVQHPDVFLSDVTKEAHFFDYDTNYENGLSWYSDTFFKKHKSEQAVGDITPLYMFLPQAVERIHRDLGSKLKFIFMLRDPVERAYSHYKFNLKRSYEKDTFENAIRLEPERINGDFFHHSHFSYTGRGLYAKQIKYFMKYYPKEQMHFVLFEKDFMEQKQQTVDGILKFLNLAPAALSIDSHANPTAMPRSMLLNEIIYNQDGIRKIARKMVGSVELRRKLFKFIRSKNEKQVTFEKIAPGLRTKMIEQYFKPDIHELEKLLDRDLSRWLK
jgi:hypothetical protein